VTGSAGWRLGGGSRQPSRPIRVFKNSGCPLCRNQLFKIFPCAALPSLSRTVLEKRGQILPKNTKEQILV